MSETKSLLQDIKEGFRNPSMEYRPRTRWWWPGSAVTREDIAWELQQMHDKGMGGVEICSVWNMYEKGNIPYLSDEWLKMIKYTIQTAKKLGMSVALTFSPGWTFGGFWVKIEDRSKNMVPAWVDIQGPRLFNKAVPEYKKAFPSRWSGTSHMGEISTKTKLIAVVAGKLIGDTVDVKSLLDLTSKIEDNKLNWQVPEGNWRIMSFWLKLTGQQNQAQNYKPENWSLDHFNKEAVQRYCDYLGGKFYNSFGDEFGKTVDSFFCDSFEVKVLPDGIYWSDDLLDEFGRFKGYDLTRYLPVIWWDIGELTPKIRYDVNEFLHYVGMEALFKPFINWCKEHNIQARIQPHYRFTEEIVQGSGITPRPECEVTTAYFEVVMIPRKSVSSGAHLYGWNIVSAEAYTFLHRERYRSTLEELKVASDAFMRDGVNQFYNHGYNYSPEKDVSPARSVPWANLISHPNMWWRYYPYLTKYLARACYLLRQGRFAPDIAVYSPYATDWTRKVVWGNERRLLPYGNLGRTLVANGYDFDIVNDDILLNYTKVQDGKIKIRGMEYKFLILPHVKAIPLKTMEFIRDYIQAGGVLIALDSLPDSSVGLNDYKQKDEKVQEIVKGLFTSRENRYGQGYVYYFPRVINQPWSPGPRGEATKGFLMALRNYLSPDFSLEEMKESEGLTFIHRKMDDVDIYFVTNLQDRDSDIPITFRVKGKLPQRWNPYTGKVSPIQRYKWVKDGISIPLHLNAYESTFVLFKAGKEMPYVTETNLMEIEKVTANEVTGLASENGLFMVTLNKDGDAQTKTHQISQLPAPYVISGKWKLILEGKDFPRTEKTIANLTSWTNDPTIRHFSGTGRYEVDFDIPDNYIKDDIELVLDLGRIGDIAEMELNDKRIGVAWMRPYRLNITKAAEKGINHLVILVTNTLINRVSGFKEAPPVPKELVSRYGSAPTDYVLGRRGREIGFEPLSPSGLMGPVRIVPIKRVSIGVRS